MGITSRENEKYIEEWERKYSLPYHMKDTVDRGIDTSVFWYHFTSGSHQEKRRAADKMIERTHGKDILGHIRKAHPEE